MKKQFINLLTQLGSCCILAIILYVTFITLGGYKFEDVQPAIFTFIFLPIITMTVSYTHLGTIAIFLFLSDWYVLPYPTVSFFLIS